MRSVHVSGAMRLSSMRSSDTWRSLDTAVPLTFSWKPGARSTSSRPVRRDGQLRTAAQAHRVVDAVGLGDRAPAGGVAVVREGDRLQRVAVAHDVAREPGQADGGRVLAARVGAAAGGELLLLHLL